jgi:hypothetical protein
MVLFAFVVSLLGAALAGSAAQAAPERPSHVVIMVLDQARPDTITRYGMTNVERLQREGKSFHNAIVGDMAAETVISHNVITSGLFPKHMGWSNEVYRDEDNVLGVPGAYYVTSSMSCAQFKALIAHGNYPKIQDYLDSEFGEGSRFASITQKRTSACTSGQTRSTDPEDIIMQIRGSSTATCDGRSAGARRSTRTARRRRTSRTWPRHATGGRPGRQPARTAPTRSRRRTSIRSTATASCRASRPGTWAVTPGPPTPRSASSRTTRLARHDGQPRRHRQDGPHVGPRGSGRGRRRTRVVEEMRHLPFVARNADAQVGKVVDALDAKGILDDTLIVITADHAAQTGNPFFGVLAPGVSNPRCAPPSTGIRSDCNWYYGRTRTRSTSTRARPSRRCGTGWPGTSRSPTRTRRWPRTSTTPSLARRRRPPRRCSTCPA